MATVEKGDLDGGGHSRCGTIHPANILSFALVAGELAVHDDFTTLSGR
ncbi:MAG: hypothetical protein R3D29_00475 [Nitratireductor sp.]